MRKIKGDSCRQSNVNVFAFINRKRSDVSWFLFFNAMMILYSFHIQYSLPANA
jgi:hypothetical protein